MEEYVIIALFGVVVALDTTVAGQFMISQPLFAAPAAGYFLGDFESGLYIGTIMQLLWLKQIPMGGSVYLNGNLGSLTALSVCVLCAGTFRFSTEGLRFTAIVYGILTSYAFGYFTKIHRQVNLRILSSMHRAMDAARLPRFQALYVSGILYTGIGGGMLTVVFALTGAWAVLHIPARFFTLEEDFFRYGLYAFWGIGAGTVLSMVWSRKAWLYPAAGAALGVVILFFT